MLFAFLLGLGLIVLLLTTANWFTSSEPKDVLRVLKWVVFGVLGALFIFLVVTNRLGLAMAALAAMVPWVMRLLRLLLLGRAAHSAFGGMFNNPFRGMGDSGSGASGQRSSVQSRFLDMSLDHGSGAMEGTVREGRFEGRELSDLSDDDRLHLWEEVRQDPDSLRLLEAWLDRQHPNWRDESSARQDDSADERASSGGRRATGSGTMSRSEALEMLGLPEGSSADEVRTAWRRLMAGVHPDKGGSVYLAAKLNEAKDVLLGRRK